MDFNQLIGDLLFSERLSDILLIAKNNVTLPAHKFILSLRSCFFESMLIDHPDIREFRTDLEENILRGVVKYLYTNKIELTSDIVLSVLSAAQIYQINGIHEECSKLIATLSPEDLVRIFRGPSSENASDSAIQATKTEFLRASFGHLVHSDLGKELLLSLPESNFVHLLQDDSLASSEIDVFHAILAWVDAKIPGGKDAPPEVREAFAQPFVIHCRLPLLTPRELAEIVFPSHLVSEPALIEAFAFTGSQSADSLHILRPVKPRVPKSPWKLSTDFFAGKSDINSTVPTGYPDTHDGGAVFDQSLRTIVSTHGNNRRGTIVQLINVDTGAIETVVLPFGTHGSFPILDSNAHNVYFLESVDEAPESGLFNKFCRLNIPTREITDLPPLPEQSFVRYSRGTFLSGSLYMVNTNKALWRFSTATQVWDLYDADFGKDHCHILANRYLPAALYVLDRTGSFANYNLSTKQWKNLDSLSPSFEIPINYPSLMINVNINEFYVIAGCSARSLLCLYSSLSNNWTPLTTWSWPRDGGHVVWDQQLRHVLYQKSGDATWRIV